MEMRHTYRNQTIPDGIDPATVPQISEPRLGFLVPVEDADGNVVGHTPYYRARLHLAGRYVFC